ncbi:MAG: tRNA pseudouridine(38-40) synthase TruA [Pseudomonadota bacterium]|jgi:tRNA pseudouridine38-40 synthase
MTTTYRLVVEYDGTRWSGWQEQHNAKTIGGELRRAFEASGITVDELGAAGRTDAGVHAIAQVAHLRVPLPFDPRAVLPKVHAALSQDIAIVSLEPAAPRFHARHHARLRSYAYRIARRRSALERKRAWCLDTPLDVTRMQAAAALCMGEQDWKLYMHAPSKADVTKVAIARCTIEDLGALIVVRIEADHFLWRMVRRLVGALVRVGSGDLSLDQFAALLRPDTQPARAHEVADWTAPACGLYLERVLYPGDLAIELRGDVHLAGYPL